MKYHTISSAIFKFKQESHLDTIFFQCHVNERSYLAGNKKKVRLEWDYLISMMKKIMELTYFSWWGKWYTQKAAFGNCLILQQSQLNQCGISQAVQWEGTDLTPKTGTLESRVHYELVLILEPPNQVIPVVNLNKLSGYKYTINESVGWGKVERWQG